jgi:hypothetical protein
MSTVLGIQKRLIVNKKQLQESGEFKLLLISKEVVDFFQYILIQEMEAMNRGNPMV